MKKDDYNSILIIINKLTKMIYYKIVNTTINLAKQAKFNIDLIVKQNKLFEFIFSDKNVRFI